MNKERDILQKIVEQQKTIKNPNTQQVTQQKPNQPEKFVYTPPEQPKK